MLSIFQTKIVSSYNFDPWRRIKNRGSAHITELAGTVRDTTSLRKLYIPYRYIPSGGDPDEPVLLPVCIFEGCQEPRNTLLSWCHNAGTFAIRAG